MGGIVILTAVWRLQARDRQLYHLRHTRDYEALGIPIGSSKAEARKAYRDLAKVRRRTWCRESLYQAIFLCAVGWVNLLTCQYVWLHQVAVSILGWGRFH